MVKNDAQEAPGADSGERAQEDAQNRDQAVSYQSLNFGNDNTDAEEPTGSLAMRCSRILAALLAAVTYAAPITPVHTIVRDRGGVVHVKLIPTENHCGVLHLRMTGKKISRVAAKRSIQATTAGIHKCKTCTAVVEMGECNGVSPLALPVTAQFLLSHPTLKHIFIIEARGAVLLACRTVKRLSGHDKFDVYHDWKDFEAACGKSAAAAYRRAALKVAKRYRPTSSGDSFASRLQLLWTEARQKGSQAGAGLASTWKEHLLSSRQSEKR